MLPTTDKETKQHTQKNKNTQRAQTCADAKKFNRKRSEIRIRIFVLIRIRMSVGSVTKCCGCITLSTSLILPSIKKGKAAYSSSWNSPQNYGTPLVNGITQCYLPPDRGDLMVLVWYKSAVDCKNNANKCPNIHYSAMVKKMKKWSGIHTQIRITTKS